MSDSCFTCKVQNTYSIHIYISTKWSTFINGLRLLWFQILISMVSNCPCFHVFFNIVNFQKIKTHHSKRPQPAHLQYTSLPAPQRNTPANCCIILEKRFNYLKYRISTLENCPRSSWHLFIFYLFCQNKLKQYKEHCSTSLEHNMLCHQLKFI